MDIAGGCNCIPSMQVTWLRLMSPTSSHRKLPLIGWRRCPNLFRFCNSTAKDTTKWMVELPDIVYGLLEIGAYARTASEGATYCPVCIWLTFKTRVPGC